MTEHTHGEGGHAHSHIQTTSAKRLTIALVLTGAFLIAEVVGGLYFKSLALLSDAAHMFTDVAAPSPWLRSASASARRTSGAPSAIGGSRSSPPPSTRCCYSPSRSTC